MKICVTGASGRAGRAVVRDLMAHGHHVTSVDLVMPVPDDLDEPLPRANGTCGDTSTNGTPPQPAASP
jgi:nucleoside-diphosphate-sugar epimerase